MTKQMTSGSVFPYRTHNKDKEWIIEQFEATGYSTHTNAASTLGIVIEHCIRNDIDFKLTHVSTKWVTGRPPACYLIERRTTTCGILS